MGYDWESGSRSGQHPRLPPLRPGFDPGLVRELWLVDLNLTPRVFLRVYRFSSLSKNQPLRQVVSSSVWITPLWLGRLVTTPNVPTLNKSYIFLWFTRTCWIHLKDCDQKDELLARFRFSLQYFKGNRDQNSVAPHRFYPPIKARYIRIHPWGWYAHISMRTEFYGCAEGRKDISPVSCLSLLVLILPTAHKETVWVTTRELIIESAFIWSSYRAISSSYCTTYLWSEVERRKVTLIIPGT